MPNRWTGPRPSPSTASRPTQGSPCWEDRPVALIRLEFRAHEAEMARERAAPPAPSPLNAVPGAKPHAGWTADWITDMKKIKAKANKATALAPPESSWRVKGWD